MNRRDWLKQGSIALGGALLGWGLPGRWVDRDLLANPQWSYTGATGPNHWAALDGAFQTCAIGRQQSPIDLQTLGGPMRRTLRLDYGPAGTRIRNTGRSIFVDCRTQACTIGFGGQLYNLMQFHFHHPSEHHLAGQSFPAEVHFVHRSEAGELLVLGQWLMADDRAAQQPASQLLDRILQQAPQTLGSAIELDEWLNPADLVAAEPRSLYTYSGSLTTPPCSEGVTWVLMPEPLAIAPATLDRLQARLGRNARPLQVRSASAISPPARSQ